MIICDNLWSSKHHYHHSTFSELNGAENRCSSAHPLIQFQKCSTCSTLRVPSCDLQGRGSQAEATKFMHKWGGSKMQRVKYLKEKNIVTRSDERMAEKSSKAHFKMVATILALTKKTPVTSDIDTHNRVKWNQVNQIISNNINHGNISFT